MRMGEERGGIYAKRCQIRGPAWRRRPNSEMLLLLIFVDMVLLRPVVFGQTFPSTVELDLVFPSHGSWRPVSDFPIIFGIQNAAPALRRGLWVKWRLLENDFAENPDPISQGELNQSTSHAGSFLSSGSYLWVSNSSAIAKSVSATWNLTWTMGFYQNCTLGKPVVSPEVLGSNGFETHGSKDFITSSKGKTPIFSGGDPCPQFCGQIRIDSIINTTRGEACPVLKELPAGPGNACGFPISPTIANKIASEMKMSTSCASEVSLGYILPLIAFSIGAVGVGMSII
ncbi:hypothetical protein BJ875DRAFT_138196 [Amylocarpus encephaloides]|uniref:DUF7136 domain-containing protein n=1 Tax=Amylocarpus encephaloides TaxID=45428 RepID=A0A9P7YC01_9HELO|nr:hypothetical protein BJ875DRAFT_138196 [Amylocarpus encephaloides]